MGHSRGLSAAAGCGSRRVSGQSWRAENCGRSRSCGHRSPQPGGCARSRTVRDRDTTFVRDRSPGHAVSGMVPVTCRQRDRPAVVRDRSRTACADEASVPTVGDASGTGPTARLSCGFQRNGPVRSPVPCRLGPRFRRVTFPYVSVPGSGLPGPGVRSPDIALSAPERGPRDAHRNAFVRRTRPVRDRRRKLR